MARELIGDINNDGKISTFDLLLIFAESTGTIQLNDDEISRGDVDYDGVVGIPDAARIRAHITGEALITHTITNV